MRGKKEGERMEVRVRGKENWKGEGKMKGKKRKERRCEEGKHG